jgi:predicted alpha/beta hydrolase
MSIDRSYPIILARDGFPLHGILREPTTVESKGFIQIHPGWGLHQFTYNHFANFLADAGYTVLTFDYRGIGRSAIPYKMLKKFDAPMSDHGLLDMPAVLDWAIKYYPDQKKIVIGHSLGGQILGLMDNCGKIDRVYTIGSAVGYFKILSKPMDLLLPKLFFKLVPLYVFIYRHSGIMKKALNKYLGITGSAVIEWKAWCSGPEYFRPCLGKPIESFYFDKIHAPFVSIRVEDDLYANDITTPLFLSNYPNADIKIKKISLQEAGARKIGHTGFFRKKFKKIWQVILEDLEAEQSLKALPSESKQNTLVL